MNNASNQPTSATSDAEKLSEIHALTLRADSLGHQIDFWNTSMLWALVATAAAAIAVVFTTRMVLGRSKELAAVQENLLNAKDEQLKRDLKYKDERIAEATARAAEADLARARLESRLDPRRIDVAARNRMKESLRAFAGTKVNFGTLNATSESKGFTNDLIATLNEAGLIALFETASQTTGGTPPIRFIATRAMAPFMDALAKALASEGLADMPIVVIPPTKGVVDFKIEIGPKSYP